MEGLMFVDGVYPDFSLLKEVLLPPYFESDPPCSSEKDAPSGERTTLLAQLQYQESPRDAAVELMQCGQAENTTMQYRRRASRGRKKRGAKIRASSVKVNNSCLPRTHTKNSLKIGQKMSCVAEITEPGIIYLLEESIQKLPKIEGNLEDDHVLKNLCTMTGEHVKTLSGKNGYSMTQAPSTMASNAMELLNLINIKCTHLNKLGDDLRIEDMDHQRKHNGGRDGQPKMVEDEIQISDLLTLASANKPQKFWNSPNINGDLICEEHNLSTRAEESSVERVENQTGESSLQSISTDYGGCIQKTPRKQPTPRKGVENLDPSFKGIEFQMHLCFGKEKCDDCQLIVTSCYSRGRSRRKSIKSRLRFKSTSLSSGSEDDHLPAPSSRSKQCASCKTQKTPLWRDAEDGTPLCNACGIRYKKYGLKCGRCWNIPKRDGKSCSKYCGCGGIFV